jgi:hypothetical protein
MELIEPPNPPESTINGAYLEMVALRAYRIIIKTVAPLDQLNLGHRLDKIGWPLVLRSAENIATIPTRPWIAPWHEADSRALRFLYGEFNLDFDAIAQYFLLARLEDQCHQQYLLLRSSTHQPATPEEENEAHHDRISHDGGTSSAGKCTQPRSKMASALPYPQWMPRPTH